MSVTKTHEQFKGTFESRILERRKVVEQNYKIQVLFKEPSYQTKWKLYVEVWKGQKSTFSLSNSRWFHKKKKKKSENLGYSWVWRTISLT